MISDWSKQSQTIRYTNRNKRVPLDHHNTCSFKYPSGIQSNYKNDYHKQQHIKKEIFNLEREHRIINPHKMQLMTIKDSDYKPFKAEHRPRSAQLKHKNDAPTMEKSSYNVRIRLCKKCRKIILTGEQILYLEREILNILTMQYHSKEKAHIKMDLNNSKRVLSYLIPILDQI